MLKIRLRRMGSRHRPFYRVVVSDSRRTPLATALDELGYYDPRHSPSVFKVDLDKVDHWISKGAQPSETLNKLVRKARKGAFTDDAPAGDAAEAPVEKKAEKPEKADKKADKAEKKAEKPEKAAATEVKKAEGKAEAKAKATPAAEEAPAAEAEKAEDDNAKDKGEA